MNTNYLYNLIGRYQLAVIVTLLSCFLFINCGQEPQEWQLKSTDQVAGDFIENNPDLYAEFGKLVEVTGLRSLLNIRGPFTILLPTDSAMLAYYQLKNVNSLSEIPEPELQSLVRYHIVPSEITTGDIGLGSLRDANALGDFLATEFQGSDIYINKNSKIIKRDIRTANGYIHIINTVIDPVTRDIFSILAADPAYKIFSDGLNMTGLKDTLQIIQYPYGSKIARTRFTMLAVPDVVYQERGINNVNELIAWTGASSDNLTSLNNPFYRYMEYHCLNNSFYLSDFETSLYPILSRDNNVSVTIAEDYKLNLDRTTNQYTGFILEGSNVPAKNGVIHAINDLLPVIDPEPTPVTFETTDFLEFKEGDFYGKYYYKWADGQNSFEKIKFNGDYLLYYYKPNHGRTEILNNDNLSMIGFWWIEITFPKVMKGRYAVTANIWSGGDDLPMFAAYIDGVKVADINARIGGANMDFGEVNWATTEEHKIKLVCTGWGTLFWDSVTFTPIQ